MCYTIIVRGKEYEAKDCKTSKRQVESKSHAPSDKIVKNLLTTNQECVIMNTEIKKRRFSK